MFHRTREAIEAHLTIVFTALAVAHCIQERTGLAIANVIKQPQAPAFSHHPHQRRHADLPTTFPGVICVTLDYPISQYLTT